MPIVEYQAIHNPATVPITAKGPHRMFSSENPSFRTVTKLIAIAIPIARYITWLYSRLIIIHHYRSIFLI